MNPSLPISQDVGAVQASPLIGTTPAGLVSWLASGKRGMSSNAMVEHLVGIPTDKHGFLNRSHPYDPDDLDRCLQLLEAVPLLRLCLPYMATCSPAWKGLIANWEAIEQSHLDEVGLRWTKARSAPKTYELMRSILDAARADETKRGAQP